jgi:uncharacterized protein YgiB involved in biofilm formation
MTAQPKRKRSRSLTLTTMLAGASLTVVACGDDVAPSRVNTPEGPRAEQMEAFPYASLEACKTSDQVPDSECDTAYAAALKDNENAPRYDDRKTCEDIYGAGNCVPRQANNGGSFFMPLLAGFVVGRMLDGGGRDYYRGTGLYRDRYDFERGGQGYRTGWGGGISRDYTTGRSVINRQSIDPPAAIRQAPPRVQTRTSVVSRGGFGGGRGFGG